MSTIQLQPPEPFNFRKPDEWPRWIKRFEQFRLASALSTANPARQVSTFLYCLGPDAEDTLQSMSPSEEDRATFAAVKAKFEGFFRVRRNTIIERVRSQPQSSTRRRTSGTIHSVLTQPCRELCVRRLERGNGQR